MRFEEHLTKPVPGFNTANVGTTRSGRPARIWKRTGAFLIDIIIFNIIIAPPFQGFITPPVGGLLAQSIDSVTLTAVTIMILLFFTYVVLLQYLIDQTIGMMLFRITVVHHDSFWRTLLRNLFILPFFPFFILWVLDPLFLIMTGERLSEKWTGTRTIEE